MCTCQCGKHNHESPAEDWYDQCAGEGLLRNELSIKITVRTDPEEHPLRFKRIIVFHKPADLSAVPPDIVAKLQAVLDLCRGIAREKERLSWLQQELETLTFRVRATAVRLKHAIWDVIPPYRYGMEGLRFVQRPNTQQDAVILDEDDKPVWRAVSPETAKELEAMQRQIAEDEGQIKRYTQEAEILEQKVEHKPELLDVEAIDAMHLVSKHLSLELLEQLMTGEAFFSDDGNGGIALMVPHEICEESDQLPPEELELLRLMYERSGTKPPADLAELLGIQQKPEASRSQRPRIKGQKVQPKQKKPGTKQPRKKK